MSKVTAKQIREAMGRMDGPLLTLGACETQAERFVQALRLDVCTAELEELLQAPARSSVPSTLVMQAQAAADRARYIVKANAPTVTALQDLNDHLQRVTAERDRAQRVASALMTTIAEMRNHLTVLRDSGTEDVSAHYVLTKLADDEARNRESAGSAPGAVSDTAA